MRPFSITCRDAASVEAAMAEAFVGAEAAASLVEEAEASAAVVWAPRRGR
jgi:hypothetical protein